MTTAADKTQELFVRVTALALIYVIAFAARLFSVLRYESVIHEFDPYFNFRSTTYLAQEGWYNFANWFDDGSWYPLGRIIGFTVYPGLMWTSAIIYWILEWISFPIDIRNVCVFTAPFFASNTAIITYLFAKEIKDANAGLVAAALIAIVPGYISRSVAGSFDNEGVAIFALIFTFYMWVKAVKTGSLFWSAMCTLAYFYMVSAWGGYIFIINLIPLYVVVMILADRYSHRLYVAYSTVYVLGTLLAMQIRFVGFQAVQSGEHMAAAAVFALLQMYAIVDYLKSNLTEAHFAALVRFVVTTGVAVAATAVGFGVATGYISPWTGRFWTLLDPTYAKKHIPIIASVSEHQPTTWSSFFFDLHMLVFMFPVGMYFCFKNLTDASIFAVCYGICAVYFAGVMVRLMLVLAPAACIMAAIGISSVLQTYMAKIREEEVKKSRSKEKQASRTDVQPLPYAKTVSALMITGVTLMMVFYVYHCTWVTSEAYSSPSIVLAAKQGDGSRIIFDDFREAYYWLRHNTPEDARVMSWWDYGYQITGMANRTILVDNNTWNNTHIATVGKAMSSNEETAYGIMRDLDVDYVLVIFGGLTGYASDDINKFLWMVRIAGSVDPTVKEEDYLSSQGDYTIDSRASQTMLDSLMYKMCYYRFGQVMTEYNRPTGYDRVRGVEIGRKEFELEYVEEAYTTSHWIVRIYKVKKPENRW